MKKSLLALALAVPMTLTGCVVAVGGDDDNYSYQNHESQEYKNRKAIARMDLGTTYETSSSRLGVADFFEKYEVNGDLVQVAYYRTHRVHKDGLTTKDECTYLKFVNGKLVETGVGK